LANFRFATLAEIDKHFGCEPGYLGPVGLRQALKVVADREVALMADFVCGANVVDAPRSGVNWGRDLREPDVVADIRNVVEGDASPDGKGPLAIERGIEVGHIFYLGTKYSQAMGARLFWM
jgi:prolyl-tRNA synthetase